MTTTIVKEEFCSVCGALNPMFDETHGFYTCKACGNNWGYDKDDPDYSEYYEETICPACDGSGENQEGTGECRLCGGSGLMDEHDY